MWSGVPGIGTNIGGIPEVIEHGVNGYIVEPGDTKAVADYAVELLQDDKKHQQFRQEALASVEKNFHESYIIEQYERIYERLAVKNDVSKTMASRD